MERTIKFYHTMNDRCPVDDFLEDLDDRSLSKVLAVFKLIETQERVPEQYLKKISGYELWEVRVGMGGKAFRFPCFWSKGSLIILTHGFVKKSQKTPGKELRKALAYKADWEGRS